MFNINFISKPGLKEDDTEEFWSFLNDQEKTTPDNISDIKKTNKSFIKIDDWKNYVFVCVSLGLIFIMSIINNRFLQQNFDVVLNQVFDLIIESEYAKNFELEETMFNKDQINVIIKSKEILTIQNLVNIDNLENEFSFEIFKKGTFSYLDLSFPWDGNEKGGDLQILKSMIDKIIFSDDVYMNHTKEVFQFQGMLPDIVTFLLNMAENKQIKKFNFSISQQDARKYNLIIQLNIP